MSVKFILLLFMFFTSPRQLHYVTRTRGYRRFPKMSVLYCLTRTSWMRKPLCGIHMSWDRWRMKERPVVDPESCTCSQNATELMTAFHLWKEPMYSCVIFTFWPIVPCNTAIYNICSILMVDAQLHLPADTYQVLDLYLHLRNTIRSSL